MATVPFSMPGQQNMPGNAAPTQGLNYSFLPGARGGATQQDGTNPFISSNPSLPTGNTGNPNTGQVPIPYTANNYQSASNVNNPFSNYTGFNLGLNSASELNSMFGPLGDALYYYLNNGAGYNPAVLNSLINQIQPQVQEGLATLGSTAGMTGNRFGSAYQLGTADYLSQVNQNELAMGSQLYQHSQDTINQDLMGILPYSAIWKNNQGGFLQNLLGALIPTLGNIPTPGRTPSPTPRPGPKPPGPALPPWVQPTFPGQPTIGQQTPTPGHTDPVDLGPIGPNQDPPGASTTTITMDGQTIQGLDPNSPEVQTTLQQYYDQGQQTGNWDNYWAFVESMTGGTQPTGDTSSSPSGADPYAGSSPISDLTNSYWQQLDQAQQGGDDWGNFGGWGGGGDFGGEAYYG